MIIIKEAVPVGILVKVIIGPETEMQMDSAGQAGHPIQDLVASLPTDTPIFLTLHRCRSEAMLNSYMASLSNAKLIKSGEPAPEAQPEDKPKVCRICKGEVTLGKGAVCAACAAIDLGIKKKARK